MFAREARHAERCAADVAASWGSQPRDPQRLRLRQPAAGFGAVVPPLAHAAARQAVVDAARADVVDARRVAGERDGLRQGCERKVRVRSA